jgi:hypothetical protein
VLAVGCQDGTRGRECSSDWPVEAAIRTELILLFGPKKTRTAFGWSCLEGIPYFLSARQWVRIGANRDVQGDEDGLDGYMKGFIKRQTADYVAVVLERAGLIELDRGRPARVRLRRADSQP